MGAWGCLCLVRSLSSIHLSLNDSCWKYWVGKVAESFLFGSGSLQMGHHLK